MSQTKAEIRKEFRLRRDKLSEQQVNVLSEAVVQKFMGHFVAGPATVHTFLTIEDKKEIQTWGLVNEMWSKPWLRVLAAQSDLDTHEMTHFVIKPSTRFKHNAWGIPEPENVDRAISPKEIDIVLVPLLAFDNKGHRVGYGKGFYDRFLSQCRDDVKKVGLSLFEPVLEIADAGEHDIHLSACVTPSKIWKFDQGQ